MFTMISIKDTDGTLHLINLSHLVSIKEDPSKSQCIMTLPTHNIYIPGSLTTVSNTIQSALTKLNLTRPS